MNAYFPFKPLFSSSTWLKKQLRFKIICVLSMTSFMVGYKVLQTITHSFNSFGEKSFMTIYLPVQTKQFNWTKNVKFMWEDSKYWFFQWLKWCSCCEGHYAGRVDFGIDFNVSPYALHSIYLEQSVHIQKQCQSSVCVCVSVWQRKSERVDL